MTKAKDLSMKCICPACGIRAPLEEHDACIEIKCPACGANMSNLDDKGSVSGSNVPNP